MPDAAGAQNLEEPKRVPKQIGIKCWVGTASGSETTTFLMGERQSIVQKGVRAIDARNPQLDHGSNAAKTSVRAPGLSADECEHPFL